MSKLQHLWYTRCPVPTPLGIAVQLDGLVEEFAKDGVEIKSIRDSDDRSVRESHFDHKLDHSFRQGGNIPAIWAKSAGSTTKVVGLTWTDEAQVILALDPKIRTLSDLRGKRLAVPRRLHEKIDWWRATVLRGYLAALSTAGIREDDVELVDLIVSGNSFEAPWSPVRQQGAPEVIALARGDVDAIFHKGSRGLEIGSLLGAHVVYDLATHPDPKIRVNNGSPRTLTVDEKLLADHPEAVERILRRVLLAGEWAKAHREDAIRYIARETGSTEAWVEVAYGKNVHEHLETDLDDEHVAALSDLKDFLYAKGFLPHDFDVHAWVDARPLRAAIKSLGLAKTNGQQLRAHA